MNTIEDFLRTAQDLQADITCPSCGSPMAAQIQGSYELVLTPRARNEFNNVLSLYRRFLIDLEEQLRTHNLQGVSRAYGLPYPYIADYQYGEPPGSGLFSNQAVDALREYLGAFDRYDRQHLIAAIPIRNAPGELDNRIDAVIEYLLLGLEPNLIIGPLANVILGQRHIASWIDVMMLESGSGGSRIDQVLEQEQVCPNIANYLAAIARRVQREAKADPGAASVLAGGQVRPEEVTVLIQRAKLLLVLLLGHRAEDPETLTRQFMRKQDPYRLPAEVQVQSRFLGDIVSAAVLLRRNTIGLSDEFRHLVSEAKFGQPGNRSPAGQPGLLATHEEIAKLVHFVCTGEPSWLPPEVEKATGSAGAQRFNLEEARRSAEWSNKVDEENVKKISVILGVAGDDATWSSGQVWFEATRPARCGWYPKAARTHGVTLLGGPGAGKSSVMTTGLPTFVRAAFGLGLRIRFEDADDNLMYSAYDDLYWRGILPAPTEIGVRHSIELYAEETADPSSRTHFVFTDIPGEVVAGGIQDPGTHPIILNSLRHAKTIVFFLDLTLERDFRESISLNKVSARYPRLKESADHTRTDRGLTVEGTPDAAPRPSRADVSQVGILYQLIEDLRMIHNRALFDDIDVIVIIPKADLYARADGEKADPSVPDPFLETFFKQMRDLGILNESPYREQSSTATRGASGRTSPLPAWRSTGAVPVQDSRIASGPAGPIESSLADGVRKQYAEQLRTISDAARNALCSVGAADNAEGDPETRALGDFLRFGLVESLEEIFTAERVHFFPVSATGAGTPRPLSEETTATKAGEKRAYRTDVIPPNQLLPELVFAAPISIALTSDSDASVSHPPR